MNKIGVSEQTVLILQKTRYTSGQLDSLKKVSDWF